jgi:hypothetical protein
VATSISVAGMHRRVLGFRDIVAPRINVAVHAQKGFRV